MHNSDENCDRWQGCQILSCGLLISPSKKSARRCGISMNTSFCKV